MKKIILLTFILLFQSFSSFGNPNGKGLICECKLCPNYKIEFGTYFEGKRPSVYGYFLKDNKVTYLQVTNKDNKIFFRKSLYNKTIDFRESPDFIFWGNGFPNSYKYKLNRQTLILEKKMVGRDKPDTIRQCSVYSEKEFGKIQDKIISQYQNKLDYKLSKNKI